MFLPISFGGLIIVCAVMLIPILLYFGFLAVRGAQKDVEETEEAEAVTPHTGIRDVQVLTDHGVEHRYENRADDED